MKAKQFLLLATLCFGLPCTAQLRIYYVTPEGNATSTGAYWNTSISLYGALSKAAPGNTICIAKGDYSVNPAFGSWEVTKNLTIIGGYDRTEYPGEKPHGNASATVLHGRKQVEKTGENKRVMNIAGTETAVIRVTVENLTMTDGNGTDDKPNIISNAVESDNHYGGALFNSYAETILHDVIIKGNIASSNDLAGMGGGIYNFKSNLMLTGKTTVQGNIASTKTGTGMGGGIANIMGYVVMKDSSRVENNASVDETALSAARSGTGYGGGIYNCREATLHVDTGTIISNKAVTNTVADIIEGQGGGIYNDSLSVTNIRHGAVIKGNVGTNGFGSGYGGGIYNTGTLNIYGGLLESNAALFNLAATTSGYGGGIYSKGAKAFVLLPGDAVIRGNTATAGFGSGYGGGIANVAGTLKVIDAVIEENRAIDNRRSTAVGYGGGIYNEEGAILEIDTPIVKDNQADNNEANPWHNIYPDTALTVVFSSADGLLNSNRATGSYALVPGKPFNFTLTAAEDRFNSIEPTVTANGIALPPSGKNGNTYTYSLQPATGRTNIRYLLDYRTITLSNPPEGLLISTHQAGNHYLSTGSLFNFTLVVTVSKYENNEPIVTVNGYPLKASEQTDSRTYLYSLTATTDASVHIELNTLASFFPESTLKIYSRNGLLVMEFPAEKVPVTVSTLAGRLKVRRNVTGTEAVALPKGIYIVKAGAEVRKIMVND
ncbi:hypothetical protein Barb4_03022 [Bacteroidales bacterium Barb4]|nr:hypothetical protein Barb4_03022 [Bacteroidales bacterium Barb4]